MASSQIINRARSRLRNLSPTQRKTDWHQNSPIIATKARSRLKKHLIKPKFSTKQLKLFRSGLPRFIPSKIGLLEIVSTFYLQRKLYIYFLILGLIFIGFTMIVLFNVTPQSVADFPFYHSYGIVTLLLFLTISCFSIFLLTHFRRGVLAGLFSGVILLLHFQNFTIQSTELIAISSFFLIIELFLTLAEKLGGQIKPHPHHRRHRV